MSKTLSVSFFPVISLVRLFDDSHTQGDGIPVAVFRADDVPPAVPDHFPFEAGLHPLGVPEHLEGLHLPEETAGAVADVEGRDLVDAEIPRHLTVLAHPLRMGGGTLDLDMAPGGRFRQDAVSGRDGEGNIHADLYLLPAEEAMELRGIFAPGAALDHQVGRLPVLAGKLAEDRDGLAEVWIAGEELNEEGLGRSGFGIMGGEGVPPPVVSLAGLAAVELAGVPRNVMLVEHRRFQFLFRSGPHDGSGQRENKDTKNGLFLKSV